MLRARSSVDIINAMAESLSISLILAAWPNPVWTWCGAIFENVSLSINRFSSVTERFFMELNTRRIDTSVARSETLSIINGMRYLKLGVCMKLSFSCRNFACRYVLTVW